MQKITNTKDIRQVITDEIGLLKDGNSNPARANAIGNLIGKLLYSVRLDIEVHRYVEKSKVKDLSTFVLTKEKK